MDTLPMLAGLLTVGAAAAALVARPAAATTRERRRERRLCSLRRDTRAITGADVAERLTDTLTPFEAGLVCRWSLEREVPPSLLWEWVERHGSEALLLCLAAGFRHRDLVDHLEDLAGLDRRSLELQAELNALGAGPDGLLGRARSAAGDQSWDPAWDPAWDSAWD